MNSGGAEIQTEILDTLVLIQVRHEEAVSCTHEAINYTEIWYYSNRVVNREESHFVPARFYLLVQTKLPL